ncbi:MAG: MFS transporter [Alphaproteobacteria bacterium]|nr:MAG: MFS transporter [Alphaproteobacteria bacterium]
MKNWVCTLSVYMRRRVICVFLMGITSGIPFLLLTSTLSAYLKDKGIPNHIICSLTGITLPYALKFLWAPLLDCFRVPFLTSLLGHRRAWLFVAQIGTAASIINLSFYTQADLWLLVVAGSTLSFLAATQDIVFEAFRVETLRKEEEAYGAGAAVMGFRVGMLISGAFALLIAHEHGWQVAYLVMAACMVLGVVGTLLADEPITIPLSSQSNPSFIGTILDFSRKRPWFIVLSFIFLFKLADTVLNTVTVIFLKDLGFSNFEVATVAKTFGIVSMIVGGAMGGVMLYKLHLRHTLIVSCLLQIIACLGYFVQAKVGHDITLLYVTMGLENITCGISQTALIAYLSRLCYRPQTAAHFAFLSSFSSLSRIYLSTFAGFLEQHMGWATFHLWISLATVPALVMVMVLKNHFETLTPPSQ